MSGRGINDEDQSEDSEPDLESDPSSLPEAGILYSESGADRIAWVRLVTSNIRYSKLILNQVSTGKLDPGVSRCC